MTTVDTKEVKNVLSFVSILGVLVLGSFIVDGNMFDMFYLVFIIGSTIRYLYITFKS